MKTIIRTLVTSDGYLRDATLEFAEGLTCIIGARGTCKSTVVETLRFVHDLDPARIEALVDADGGGSSAQGPRGLLRETLAGGTATCTIHRTDEHGADTELRLERSIDAERPRTYCDGVVETSASLRMLPVEIYSQGELLRIAEHPERRLRLVDRPHAATLAQIRARLTAAHRRIEQLGAQILALRAGIREDGRELEPMAELQQRLDALQQERPTLDPRLEQERTGFEQRQQLLSRAQACCDAFTRLLAPSLPSPPPQATVTELRDKLEATSVPQAQQLAERLHRLGDAVALLDRRLTEARELAAQTTTSLQELDAAFEQRNQRYRELRRDQEALSASLEREDRIQAQLRRMGQLRDDLAQRKAQLDAALGSRAQARRDAEACLDEIYALRLREIETIGADLGGDISLEIVQGAQSGAYVDAIAALLQGTRLKRQRELAQRIAELLTPSELVDIVEHEQVERLVELASLDKSQAIRIINHFLDNMSQVLALEAIVFDDQLEITMSVDGEPRPIEQLSRGQMATALLPLILRDADFPLVFDQPEDDLDNRFIFDELVARIRKLKRNRQLVFVTHNANIPVLGDADRVVVMAMANARLAAPPVAGTVDEMSQPILDILEGGAVAFAERRKRYEGIG